MQHALRTIAVSLRSRLCLLLAIPALLTAQKTIHVPGDAATIQAGINAAVDGDTVLVSPGTYYENIDFKGKAITVGSAAGAGNTVLDGGKNTVVTIRSGEQRNSVLRGFTVRNGSISNGGIYVGGSAPSLLQNIIADNPCYGIYGPKAAPLVQGNIITGTTAQSPTPCRNNIASGVYLENSPTVGLVPEVIGNTIEKNIDNTVNGNGGTGIYLLAGSGLFLNNIIRQNTSLNGAGAISTIYPSHLLIANNLIVNNSGGYDGAIAVDGTFPGPVTVAIVNNTIVGNIQTGTSPNSGSQVGFQTFTGGANMATLFANNVVSGDSTGPLVYCTDTPGLIFGGPYGNTTEFTRNVLFNSTGPVFNDVCQNSHGWKDQIARPLFVSAATGDYHLLNASPGIDQGSNSVVAILKQQFQYIFDKDFDGHNRVASPGNPAASTIDAGAFEQDTVDPNVPGALLTLTPSIYQTPTNTAIRLTVNATSAVGVPQGLVRFVHQEGAAPPSGTLDANGALSVVTQVLSPGVHSFVAICENCTPSPSESVVQLVLASGALGGSTNLTVTAASNPARIGDPVTLTATLTSTVTPTGQVKFTENSSVYGTPTIDSNGKAAVTVSNLSRGDHTIYANYAGDGTAAAATNYVKESIIGYASTTTLSASAFSVQSGTPIHFDLAVTAANGAPLPDLSKLQLTDRGQTITPLAIVSANGANATVTLSPGTHVLVAYFAGDTKIEPSSSSPVTVTVDGASTTVGLGLIPAQGVAFQTLNAVATVQSATPGIAPSGSVAFTGVGGASANVALSAAGTAPLGINLGAGTYTLTATFVPSNGNTLTSTATATLVINRAPVGLSFVAPFPAPIPQSQSATFNAVFDDGTGRHLATGTVMPSIDGIAGAPLALTADGKLSLNLSGLLPGTHRVTLDYPGDNNFLPATSNAASLIVLERDFKLTSDAGITLRAGTYRSMPVALTSIGDFAGDVDLYCEDLPAHASCRFSKAPLHVNAGGNAAATVTLETSALPGYEVSSANRNAYGLQRIAAVAMAPFAMLTLFGLRRRHAGLRLAVLLAMLSGVVVALNGCSGQIPASTPAGTYTVHIIGSSGQMLHTQAITLTVIAADSR